MRVEAKRLALAGLAVVIVGAQSVSCRRAPRSESPASAGASQSVREPNARPITTVAAESVVAPVFTPEQSMQRIQLPPGYRVELVAAEPLVQDPVAVDFDADGRMYVVEMRAYMPNIRGEGEERPVGRVVVLEDTDDDGRMDTGTIFLDSLVLPRTVRVLERGVLIGAPPNLFLARDTTGDLVADVKTAVRNDYGTLRSNPEHNANGLVWGLDNWLHNANYQGELRLRGDGSFDYRWTPSVGQWGISADDVGRFYRNSNEDPLRIDVVSAHYAVRDSAGPDLRGVYERLTPNVAVWPARRTPAINRGYRPQTMRPDSTLAHYTAAGSPTVYIGDRLPAELRNNVFVTEPAGNLVGRFIVNEDTSGIMRARVAYERNEFLASTDERFRPVNLASAPDGTLYVVDMYRGIIQHRAYITGYLEQKIRERGLEHPIGLGRIYRVVHEGARRGPRPRLSRASNAELVDLLAHPNGWWRTTAQRLLVERRQRSIASALREMLRTSSNEHARLHALWTLDGIGDSNIATVSAALRDSSAHVRAAALRIAESWLANGDRAIRDSAVRLVVDPTPVVRRQLAASLGELPIALRDSALSLVARAHGDDPYVGDLIASGVRGRELRFLERLIAQRRRTDAAEGRELGAVVRSLAASLVRRRDPTGVARIVAWAGTDARPRWQRLALLEAIATSARDRAGQRALRLSSRPSALLSLGTNDDSMLASHARDATDALTWPGKAGRTRAATRAITAVERERIAAGAALYATMCASCHHANGTGQSGLGKPLAPSPWVTGAPGRLIRILLHGKEGEKLMPPLGASMTNEQVAAVLSFIRQSWGNDAPPIDANSVLEVRGATTGRTKPWTDAELQRAR
jgi:mono/diheme cytochrome c family protein/glucose/arabinose dehydrogenase